jgi:hypothetical protein
VNGLKIQNSSPVPYGRTVIFSLTTTLPGTVTFECHDRNLSPFFPSFNQQKKSNKDNKMNKERKK